MIRETRLSATRLTDEELLAAVQRLAGAERDATASLVAHLAELDSRRLFLGQGFPSLFAYCTSVLRLSEDAACNRIAAARLVRRVPRILNLLQDGRLNLTTLRIIDLDRALSLLLADLARKKAGAVSRPRPSQRSRPGSRHIPAEVKRAVWLRDGGRCAFVAKDGRRCAADSLLEFHHVKPHAVGGETTIDNIALRCRPHNAHEADLLFGLRERQRDEPAIRPGTDSVP